LVWPQVCGMLLHQSQLSAFTFDVPSVSHKEIFWPTTKIK